MAKGDHIYILYPLFQHHGIDGGYGTVIHYTYPIYDPLYSVSWTYEVDIILFSVPEFPFPCSLMLKIPVPHEYDNCYILILMKLN